MDFKLVVRSQDNKKTYNLDLYGDVDINVIFNINDIRNPESIKSNYTKEFTIPATHNNSKALESLVYNGNYPFSYNPNFKMGAQLYGDNSIIIDGYLQITEIIKNENDVDAYRVTIYGEISTLFNELSGLKINDLDFSEYNHIWNEQNVINSWDSSIKYNGNNGPFVLGRGYVYPFEWRGQTENTMTVEDFFPAVFAKTIFDKIFKKADKTYSSSFLNSKDFKSLIIPFSKQHIYLSDEQKKLSEFKAHQSVDKTLTDSLGNVIIMSPLIATSSANSDASFDIEDSDLGNLFDGVYFTANKKQFSTLSANINIKLKYEAAIVGGGIWSVVGNAITCNARLFDITSNLLVASEIITIENPVGSLVGPGPFYSTGEGFVDFTGIIESGHKYKIILDFTVPPGSYSSKFISSIGGSLNGSITPYLAENSDFYNSIQENWLFEGDMIDMNQIVPDELTINDFLTSLNKMFNLYWMPDGDKNFIIEPRDVLYSSPDTQILDWTNKTNRNSEITITPLSELNNNKYLFHYDIGDDYYSTSYDAEYAEVYGTKTIEVLNDFVTQTKEINPSFKSSVLVKVNNSQRIAPAYVQQKDGFFEADEPKLRINYYGGLITTTDYFLFKSADSPNGLMKYKYPYAGHFDNPINPQIDINYGQCKQYFYTNANKPTSNLFNKYWINTISDIISPDSHIWIGELHLKPYDIITMNLFDTIQMDQVYYKINQIDYNPLIELAKVELVKTNSFLTKPNVTTEKPDVVGSKGTPLNPYGPKVWEVDKTNEREYNPHSNPQWSWKNKSEFEEFNTTFDAERSAVSKNMSLVELNNINKTTTKVKTSIHRNISDNSNFIDLKGTNNYVAPNASLIKIMGNENRVFASTNITVLGNNNTVETGLKNVTIIGNNITAKESDVTFINGIKIKGGDVFEEFNFINGSVNEVQDIFNSSVKPNLIKNGVNAVQNIGGISKINYINSGINVIQSSFY
jgi:hypothetical protein